MNLIWLSSMYIFTLTVSNTIGWRILSVGDHATMFYGVFFYSGTFIIMNAVLEKYESTDEAIDLLKTGVATQIILIIAWIGYNTVEVYNPMPSDELFYKSKMVVATIVATYVSQLIGILAYPKLKKRVQWLWARHNMSSLITQSVNTIIFVVLMFVNANMSIAEQIGMIVAMIIVKMSLSVMFTPLVYHLTKGKNEINL